MLTFTTPQRRCAIGCLAVGLVPYLVHASGYMWWAALASLLAGMLLGVRAILLVAIVCLALLAASSLAMQADGVSEAYGTGRDAIRASTAYALATETMFVGFAAGIGMVFRGLVTGAIAS